MTTENATATATITFDENIEKLKEGYKNAFHKLNELTTAYSAEKAGLDRCIEALEAEWKKKNADMIAEFERALAAADEANETLRVAVVEWCRRNEVKTYDELCGMRVSSKLEYSINDATEWAKKNAPFLLIADKKQFEKLETAKSLSFVRSFPNYTAVISSKLAE